MSARILVTGGAGFIGKALCNQLRIRQMNFIAPSRESLDLTARKSVYDTYGNGSFDVVYHLASTGVFAHPNDDTIILNEMKMVKSVLPLLTKGGKFLYAGSMAEYGLSGVLSEADNCKPNLAYQYAKYLAGKWIYEEAQKVGVVPIITRIFGVYGPGESQRRLLPSVIESMRKRKEIKLSDCLQVRDFIHVIDVANAMIDLIELVNFPLLVNLGTGVGMTIKEVLLNLSYELNSDPSLLIFGSKMRSPLDQPVLIANTTILKKTIEYVPPQRLMTKGNYLSLIDNFDIS